MIAKQKVIEQIVLRLESELAAMVQAARAAHEAATHEESKAEDQHDTRGLEASYLAGAQAGRAAALDRLIHAFRSFPVQELKRVGLGALVELDLNGKRSFHFIAGEGGGISVEVDGKTVYVVTPQSPLGEALLDRGAGDAIEVEIQNAVREYEIAGVS